MFCDWTEPLSDLGGEALGRRVIRFGVDDDAEEFRRVKRDAKWTEPDLPAATFRRHRLIDEELHSSTHPCAWLKWGLIDRAAAFRKHRWHVEEAAMVLVEGASLGVLVSAVTASPGRPPASGGIDTSGLVQLRRRPHAQSRQTRCSQISVNISTICLPVASRPSASYQSELLEGVEGGRQGDLQRTRSTLISRVGLGPWQLRTFAVEVQNLLEHLFIHLPACWASRQTPRRWQRLFEGLTVTLATSTGRPGPCQSLDGRIVAQK